MKMNAGEDEKIVKGRDEVVFGVEKNAPDCDNAIRMTLL